jgi:hypothetical protein
LQRTQKPGFLLNLLEGDSQETRFLTGFFGMDRSGTAIFFIWRRKNLPILFLSAEGYCAEGYDAES